MADKATTKSDNYDALAGIFDFMFEESKKPPQSRRPIKPKKGVSLGGTDKLADDITAALAAPGVFISDSMVEALDDAANIELGFLQADNQTKMMKLDRRGIASLIKDPDGFMKKQAEREKSGRQAGRALWAGRIATDFLVTGWAQKYGDREIQKATLAMSSAKEKQKKYDIKRAMGQYRGSQISAKAGRPDYSTQQLPEMDYMVQRSVDLLGQGAFREDWQNLSENDRARFAELVSGNNSLGNIERDLATRFGSKVAKNFDRTVRPIAKGSARAGILKKMEDEGLKTPSIARDKELERRVKKSPAPAAREYSTKIDASDPKQYMALEEENLKKRIGETQGDEKRQYEKTLFFLKGYQNDILNQIDVLQNELSQETDPDRKWELKQQIKESKAAVRILNVESLSGKLGQLEGYVNSLQQVWLPKGGGLFTNIFVTLDFLNKSLNPLANP